MGSQIIKPRNPSNSPLTRIVVPVNPERLNENIQALNPAKILARPQMIQLTQDP